MFYFLNQGQWDMDSSVLFACKVYGLNRQFPYDETIGDRSIQEELGWLDHRQVPKVMEAADRIEGEKRVRLLLELAVYYLRLPGNQVLHTDSAAAFLAAARKSAAGERLSDWLLECDALEGELLYQQGNTGKGLEYFAAVARQASNKRKAIAWHQWGLHLPFKDPNRVAYLEKAFNYYQQLGL
ncbi:MAG TPA: hypothetical protein VI233_08590, partial [Puia sp.]